MKKIKLVKEIMNANDTIAAELKEMFKQNKNFTVNVLGSPGSGKTTFLAGIIESLDLKCSVIVGDLFSDIDAVRLNKVTENVIQLNTQGGCHLDARMIKAVIKDIPLAESSVIFIENVGNLVCPAAFDLGENLRIIVSSVAEGHDKPLKYSIMFNKADVVILNKIDLVELSFFDKKEYYDNLSKTGFNGKVFEVCAISDDTLSEFVQWFKSQLKAPVCRVSGTGREVF